MFKKLREREDYEHNKSNLEVMKEEQKIERKKKAVGFERYLEDVEEDSQEAYSAEEVAEIRKELNE
jgi:hypothetical protein